MNPSSPVPLKKDWRKSICTIYETIRSTNGVVSTTILSGVRRVQVEPIDRCISTLKEERNYDEVIFTSPDGEQLTQRLANELSMKGNLIILCGHYKGVDQRVRDHLITREISVGDYVLTGGELPAAIIADAVVRLVPGVLSDDQSALSDCFQDDMLSAPIYTRPREYKGWTVPEVLLSGNEAKIRQWEFDQAMERTRQLRPDLLK